MSQNKIAAINKEIANELAEYSRVNIIFTMYGKKRRATLTQMVDMLPDIADIKVHGLVEVGFDNVKKALPFIPHKFEATSKEDIIKRLTPIVEKYES